MAIFASFARYIFRTFTFKATFIILRYVAPYWLFNNTEIDDLESVVKVDHETRRYPCSTIHRTQSICIWKPPTRADDQTERLYDQPVLRTG